MYKPGDVLRQQFQLEQQLGIGGFSEVWRATDLEARDVVAIKIFLKQDSEGIDLCREEFRRMNYLRHPNILRPRFFSHAEDAPFFVMPFCEGGSAMDRAGEFDETALARLILQVGSALNHIHTLSNPILHNDLKPDNVLEEQPGLYVLADFGLSDRLSKKLTQSVPDDARTELINNERRAGLTPMAYRAPELFNYSGRPKQPPSKATDIWAFGATLYQLASDSLPFDKEGGLRQMTYYDTKSDLELDDIVPALPDAFTREFDSLIKQCLEMDPDLRPNAAYLVEKATYFLNNGKWNLDKSQSASAHKSGRPTVPKEDKGKSSTPPTERLIKGPIGGGETGGTALSIDRNEIDFGPVGLRKSVMQSFELKYKGLQGRIHIAVTPPFLVSLPEQPLFASLDVPVFDQEGSQVIEVHFEPQDKQTYEGDLYVSHPDYGQEMVHIQGEGAEQKFALAWWHYAVASGVVVLAFVAWMVSSKVGPDPQTKNKKEEPVIVVPKPTKPVITTASPPNPEKSSVAGKKIPPPDLTIYPPPFDLKFIAPTTIEVGKPVTFEDKTETKVRIRSRDWDFGDSTGSRKNTNSMQHIYKMEGDYVATLCVNDTVCKSVMIRVVKNVGPPPVCNPDMDCATSDITGGVATDRCGADEKKEWSATAQIILKPQRNIMLKSAVAYADNSGTVQMAIRESGNNCEESFSQNVAKGLNQINFVKDFTLVKGRVYTLFISTKESSISPRAPKLENLKPCNPAMGKTKDLVVDYQGNIILLDIKYCY